MSDRTYMKAIVYACPAVQADAARAALSVKLDPAPRDPGTWSGDEVACDSAADLATALAHAAPGASFVLWEDPACSWLGDVHAYTPELGAFRGECAAGGNVVLDFDQISTVIAGAASQEEALTALSRAAGQPWAEDRDRQEEGGCPLALPHPGPDGEEAWSPGQEVAGAPGSSSPAYAEAGTGGSGRTEEHQS